MKSKPNTPIRIRIQARGGMFLGPDSYDGAIISLTDVHTQEVLASGFTDKGDSGTRVAAYTIDVSPSPIVTPEASGSVVHWLVASDTTVQYNTAIQLEKPVLLKIDARIPLPTTQKDQYVSATQWVIPAIGLNTGPGFVLEIPGLWVQPEVVANEKEVRIRAKVTMMCGCEINEKTPWVPEDFVVSADIQSIGAASKPTLSRVPLSFEVNSQFIGSLQLSQQGQYEARISAFQKSTGNMGVATVRFEIE